jgi:polysaccharide deacetylase family protein (PEP-CTERM system associated)
MKCIFTIDVEDWYHILDTDQAPPMGDWDRVPSRVERNFGILLDMLAAADVRATCFFLGWIARRYPELVKSAQAAGHDIASHGFGHRLIYEMTEMEFLDDAVFSRKILEDISGQSVAGFRAAGFSLTERTPWFFDTLARAGYAYDSSLFPAARAHGGLRNGQIEPHFIATGHGNIMECPISVAQVMGKRLSCFGGGYLRLYPYSVIHTMAKRVLKENRPVIFYLHPRDIDPDQPRLPLGLSRRFKSYVNLRMTAAKVEKLLRQFEWTTMAEYVAANKEALESS